MNNVNTPFSFNSRDFNAITGFNVRSISAEPITRMLRNYSKIEGNGSVSTTERFTERNIAVTGDFIGDYSDTQLNTNILNSYLVGVNKLISFEWGGSSIIAHGTVKSVKIEETRGGYVRYYIIFILTDPFLYAQSTKTVTNNNLLTQPLSISVNNKGAYEVESIITIDINSLTAADAQTMTIGINGSSVIITRAFTALEQVIVDMIQKTVKVDGAEVAIQGDFPMLPIGIHNVVYSDSFTARQVDINILYREKL